MTDAHQDRAPADQGLSTLGLLMQLVGSLGAVFALFLMMLFAFSGGAPSMPRGALLLLWGLSATRSGIHRMAGTQLLYGRATLDGPESPLAGVKRYMIAAVLHTIAVAALLKVMAHWETSSVVTVALGLLVWPAFLSVLFILPRFSRFSAGMPVAEDKGLEGLAIVMTMFGAIGGLYLGACLVAVLRIGTGLFAHATSLLSAIALVMLFIRSMLHVRAGLVGLRETNQTTTIAATATYGNFGVIATFVAVASMLITTLMDQPGAIAFAAIAIVTWALLAWPLIVRRFVGERQWQVALRAARSTAGGRCEGQSPDFVAETEHVHRRAPDAGLTSLGWILVGAAMFGATMLLPPLLAGREVWGGELSRVLAMVSPIATESLWFSFLVIVLQLAAGFELVRMSRASRVLASAYAVIAIGLTVWQTWPVIKQLAHAHGFDAQSLVMVFPLFAWLTLPIMTLLLVHRPVTPVARARFRTADSP